MVSGAAEYGVEPAIEESDVDALLEVTPGGRRGRRRVLELELPEGHPGPHSWRG